MKRKRKILKKVCEMSKYLTLIPLLREMCFPYYHSCLEKKNDYDSGKLKFLCIFLLVTEQMWFGFWTWNHLFFFSKGEQSLSFWFHLSSSIYFLSFFLCMAGSMSPYLVEKAGSVHPSCFLNLFSIYFCLYGRRQDGSRFVMTGSVDSRSCHVRLVSLFLHSKHTPPSIFLFFLNVIVKCSSEMTLNMCTLTEGIHLVIYFLLPVSRGVFLVSLSMTYADD